MVVSKRETSWRDTATSTGREIRAQTGKVEGRKEGRVRYAAICCIPPPKEEAEVEAEAEREGEIEAVLLDGFKPCLCGVKVDTQRDSPLPPVASGRFVATTAEASEDREAGMHD